MRHAATSATIRVLGPWTIDGERRELRRAGMPVPLGARAFQILTVLGATPGALVTKDELMTRVWGPAIVEENALQAQVSAIRKALGEDRALLRTEAGRGYRLLAHEASPRQPAGGNLPAPVSPLIGRAVALARLGEFLAAHRAVTLAGPGGIGKTRLALEAAARLSAESGRAAWFIDLAPVTDPARVADAAAAALGLEAREDWTADSVAGALAGADPVLVLDNAEHVAAGAAALAEAVARRCPGAHLVATSREVLRFEGEHLFRVAALEVPPILSITREDILRHGAMQLMMARAAALRPGFDPSEDGLRALSAICRRLDGLPLAIELAAARVVTLGAPEVLARLDRRFDLLSGGRRTALPRHQTLRAALDWSHGLLDELEQCLLRRLAVHVAGFTLEAAAAVVPDRLWAGLDLAGALSGLVEKSLLLLEEVEGQARWRMLETTRAYALEKLHEHGEAQLALRGAAAFLLGRRARPAPRGLPRMEAWPLGSA